MNEPIDPNAKDEDGGIKRKNGLASIIIMC
jgi:hypothetical protein